MNISFIFFRNLIKKNRKNWFYSNFRLIISYAWDFWSSCRRKFGFFDEGSPAFLCILGFVKTAMFEGGYLIKKNIAKNSVSSSIMSSYDILVKPTTVV